MLGNEAMLQMLTVRDLRRGPPDGGAVAVPGGPIHQPSPQVPSLVREVLREPGEPLSAASVAEGGPRLGATPPELRVHADRRADRSSRQLGALAYTWGSHVVLSERARADADVLAHELTHVGQQAGRVSGEPRRVLSADSIAERQARRAQAGPTELDGIALLRDPKLDVLLAQVPGMAAQAWVTPAETSARALAKLFDHVDLTDDDNLVPIVQAISAHYPPQVLSLVLRGADTQRVQNADRVVGEQQAAHTRELMQPERRGMTGSRIPATPATLSAALLSPVAKPIADAVRSVDGFLRGLDRGFDAANNPAEYRKLQEKLIVTVPYRTAFPVVFAAGAAAGILADQLEAIRALADLPDVLAKVEELVALIFSPEGAGVAEQMGVALSQHYRGQIIALLDKGQTEFNYELGKLVGPAIVYLILSIYGVGLAELTAEAVGRLTTVLRGSAALGKALERLRSAGRAARRSVSLYRDEKKAVRIRVAPGEKSKIVTAKAIEATEDTARAAKAADIARDTSKDTARAEGAADVVGKSGAVQTVAGTVTTAERIVIDHFIDQVEEAAANRAVSDADFLACLEGGRRGIPYAGTRFHTLAKEAARARATGLPAGYSVKAEYKINPENQLDLLIETPNGGLAEVDWKTSILGGLRKSTREDQMVRHATAISDFYHKELTIQKSQSWGPAVGRALRRAGKQGTLTANQRLALGPWL